MFAALNSFLTGALAKVTDVYWPFVSMLLHGDSAQQFNQDTSTNVFPITANGAVQASTLTPFTGGPSSYGSGYFNGTTSYLSLAANAAFTIPSSTSFTIEAWIYITNLAYANGNIICANSSTSSGYAFLYNPTIGLRLYAGGGTVDINQGSVTGWTANTWYHVAAVRNGASAITLYRNGVSVATGTSTSSFGTGAYFVGASPNSPDLAYMNGYISNFRLVNGTAVYTSAFTPPTVQLTAVTNTALLTLQTNVPQNNNQFFDTSTNNFIVTRNGNTTQGSFNPFVSTYPYAVATNGGSAYFDGTGDSLTVPDNAAFTLGTNDFTIECWINFSSLASQPIFTAQMNSAANIYSYYMVVLSTGQLNSAILDASASTTYTASSAAGAILVNTWYHVAFVRNGNTNRQYINGVQAGTASVTGVTVRDSASLLGVGKGGEYAAGQLVTGYISNFRLVNGTCLYPSGTTFTPPTAPLTAVTNTALLLGMSNAAIFDNAILNNLETVASAQISTSVFKYGTGALKFNGTTDYLVTSPANQAAFAFGSGDFTIECWVYISSYAGSGLYYAVMGTGTVVNTQISFVIQINSAGTAIGAVTNNGTGYSAAPNGTTGGVALNTWTHIAVVRNGTSFITYTNGVGGTAATSSLAVYTTIQPLVIGAFGKDLTTLFSGYIDDIRITKGIARYTTTFTPPTAAFPNLGPTYPSGTATQRAIFGYGSNGSALSMTNIVSNTGVVASDTTGVGTARNVLAAAGYGGDKALFGYGLSGSPVSITNLVSNAGVVATDTTGVGTARNSLAATGYSTDKAIFGYGAIGTSVQTITNLVSNTGVVATDTAGVGTARVYIAAARYGTDKGIFVCGSTSVTVNAGVSLTNLVSNTGVVATDTAGVGTAREQLAAAGYGGDKAIYGYGNLTTAALVSITNLVSNTGVVSADVTGVGTARRGLSASNYGGDKALFGYGIVDPSTYVSITNLVSNTGVVATDTTGVGTARFFLAAAGFSYS